VAEILLSSIAAGTGGFVIVGDNSGPDQTGRSVSFAGDVNGDGFADLIVGAPSLNTLTGAAYVVFGGTATAQVDLTAVAAGTGGFAMYGGATGDFVGYSVAAAGDLNGDGLADLIVGAPSISLGGIGRSYVVFGKTGGTAVDLTALATQSAGFVINGTTEDGTGRSVSSAGDVNGDGLADLIVGTKYEGGTGRSYVVFGQTGTGAINLSAVALGSGGFVMNGECAADRSGASVSGAGDVNGDGLADLIVGAPLSDLGAGGPNQSDGRSYVVFGKTDGSAINLSSIGSGGFAINGETDFNQSGTAVANAGDVNGDGLADLIVSAPFNSATGQLAGRTYVVFGKGGTEAVDLTAVAAGTGGFLIGGLGASNYTGRSVAGAGDVNGDGLADLIVGVPDNDDGVGSTNAGRSYVVFGKTSGGTVNLASLANSEGVVLTGVNAHQKSGTSVSAAGDVNGDGLADLIVGASATAPGRAYVIFGATNGAFSGGTVVDFLGDATDNTHTGGGINQTLIGGGGDDNLDGAEGSSGSANQGVNVIHGGEGDDVIGLRQSGIAALGSGVIGGQLARVDGGSGIDTLAVKNTFTPLHLDLTAIANQGGATPGSSSRIESIERIDLTGTQNNSLTVGFRDVVDMAGMNVFNDVADGNHVFSGIGSLVQRHQLVVDGNAGDSLTMTDVQWRLVGTATNGANTYRVFNSESGYAQVLVDTDVSLTVNVPDIDLSAIAGGTGGFVINGGGSDHFSGRSVSAAGDVNGDGLADLIVGAPIADGTAGYSYVVFGKTGSAEVSLGSPGSGGFLIAGETAGDKSGWSVAAAGDVNGDGFGDLIVAAPYADPDGVLYAGRSYVVFGKGGTETVDLGALTGGFVINGGASLDMSGMSVAGAGDVNGDGFGDLIVGAWGNDDAGNAAGRSYVVFGKTGTAAVSLGSLGSGGFVITGETAGDYSGDSVASAGDVNGDGLADLIVGAPRNDAAGNAAGRSYVVFGRTGSAEVSLGSLGSGGFVIAGESADDLSGSSVAAAGDVNGDGLADLIVGAHKNDAGGNVAGRSYVVFGKGTSDAVSLASLSSGGFAITGQSANDYSGFSVASAGDVNGDGLADLIVGAYYSDPASGTDAGRSYVVFGKTGTAAIDLSSVALGSGGFVVNGECADDRSGRSVAGAGDVNGDGLADLIVGAHLNDAGGSNAGRSYVIFGSTSGAFGQTAVDQLGTAGADTINGGIGSETLVGNAGADTITGGGGADVIYGGAGDDRIVLNADNVDKLDDGVTAGNLARVDGGGGIDTLALAGSGISLNLTTIANQGGASPGSSSRIESIERIDITGNGNNTLTLDLRDVQDMAGMNSFKDGNGWTGLGASVSLHQLVIDGDAGDSVALTGGVWAATDTVTNGSVTYTVYNSDDGRAQVLVANTVAFSATESISLAGVAEGLGGFVINGQSAGARAGTSVSSAGDVNGDGLDDLIVGAANGPGSAYVVFGKAGTSAVDLSALGSASGGFVILGTSGTSLLGTNVASLGDVNGDGLADLLVGGISGRSYVVFGKTDHADVELSAVLGGTGGFAIAGTSAGDLGQQRLAAAGDVNGDGLADLIVGLPLNDGHAADAGRSFVVFGKTGTGTIELSTIGGTGGFVINGACEEHYSGRSVAGAGDVNGDGFADLIVGAPEAEAFTGRSYVVFGKSDGTAVNLASVAGGSGGFVIVGQSTGDRSGHSVAGAGDVNGDGLADLVVGAYVADPAAGADAGRSYVVFGKADGGAVDLEDVAAGTGGFVINGHCLNDRSGFAVSSAGDVNGDGLADLLIAAEAADTVAVGGDQDPGRTYVVFGKTGTAAVELSAVAAGCGGFVISGICQQDGHSLSVAAAGDVNGDGLADLIIGAKNVDAAAGSNSGRSYVIFGSTGGAFSGVVVDHLGTSAANSLVGDGDAEFIVGGAGADTLTGGGGADVLHGGAGNDRFVLNADNLAKLASGVTSGQLARVDGGTGIDMIVFSGSGLSLNLATAVANQGGATPGSSSRIESVEWIDLTGSGANTLTVGVRDVVDMAGFNVFNAGNSWTNLGAVVQKHQLVVSGNAGDQFNFAAGESASWIYGGISQVGGQTYSVFNHNSAAAQVFVDDDVMNVDDDPTGTVTIAGTVAQGQLLTANNTLADGDGLGTLAFQWKADGVNIADATSSTFTLTEAQVGKAITVTVSYTDGKGGAESMTSTATAAVANVNDALSGTVTITGTATQGQTLTANNTLADADGLGTLAFQWKADGTNIAGATASTFILTEAQVGKAITVTVSYTDGHGAAESATSEATAAVVNVDDDATVTITGTVAQGQTLTAVPADPDGVGATVTYQWKADGADLTGATASTLALTEAHVGRAITVTVGFTDGHGAVESATSAATAAVANVNDAMTGTVTVSGPTAVGGTLTAANTLADPDGLGALSYQWKADGTNIDGATASSYVLTATEVGKVITVTASYTDGHGTAESATSAATVAIRAANTTSDEGDFLSGGNGADSQSGGAGDDALNGGGGNDRLLGGEGSDTLDGGVGVDRMEGGAGDDTYVVNVVANPVTGAAGDTVVEPATGGGTDTVRSSVTYTLGANLENLVLTGTANINGTGNALNNELTGNSGNNVLSDAAGNDTFFASNGNDRFVGGAGADTLDLSAGLVAFGQKGQAGGYTVARPDANTVVITDTDTNQKFTLTGAWGSTTAEKGIESIVFSDQTVTLAQLLENTQSAFADTFTGSGGPDTMAGGAGNDTYTVDHVADVVTELPGQGTDLVKTTLDAYTLGTNVEQLQYTGGGNFAGTGNAGVNKLVGGEGADTLDGGLGADRMEGGEGNDTYVVNVVANPDTGAAGDVVFEGTNGPTDPGGTDTVRSSVTYALGVNLENLQLLGTTNISGTGNVLNNVMGGNSGNNVLTGGAGDDTFLASGGNDRFVGGAGLDTLDLSSLFAFAEKSEAGGFSVMRTDATTIVITDLATNLRYTVTGAWGATSGDRGIESFVFSDETVTLDELLENTGSFQANTLSSTAGADLLAGGLGNDTYVIDSAEDQVVEAAGQGTDLVRTALDAFTLGANVEQLLYTGSGNFAGTGNTGANKLTGGAGNDTLNGGTGADRLEGGAGNDTYVVDRVASADGLTPGDVVVELVNAGTDTVRSSVSYTLGTNVENLTLTGTANISGTGNTLANTISGNTGANTLRGGAGNDVFAFENLGAADRIADFATGADSIGLEDSIFSALEWAGGELAAGQFQSVTNVASASAGMHLIFNSTTRQLFYDADGAGTGEAAILIATLSTGTLVEADFMQL
jgi:Ca2+-binding RTX toxin-like protein